EAIFPSGAGVLHNSTKSHLIEALLEGSNLNVVCKSSAKAALDFINTRMPDLILMDIQMPEMDGYAATAHIRALVADANPIILAMTANNSPEDTQKSLAAGMQGHLCKPIDADELIKQLGFWLHANTQGPVPTTPVSAPLKAITTDELPGIDLAAALVRLRGNRTLLEEVLISFADKAALIIPELQQAIKTLDLDGATRILHRLKGTSANLSAVRVSPLAARLETQCKQGQLPNDDELIELESAIGELITTARGLYSAQSAQPISPTDVDYTAIKQCLAQIGTHLNSDLGRAEDAVTALLQLSQNTPWAAAANQLRTLFYQFNLRAVHDLILNGFEQEPL
ncbi:MAG TPA: response regulator, partial [Cellvibrionaceae bacterium]|nr:response regulator [Cellvibrionaceae bacterium]